MCHRNMQFLALALLVLMPLHYASLSPDTKVDLAPAYKKQAVIDNLTASLQSTQGIQHLDQLTRALKLLTADFKNSKVCDDLPETFDTLKETNFASRLAENA